MDSYRRRTPAQVVGLAEELRHQLAARVFSAAALGSLLGRFKFMDQHGDTWTRGPLTGAWYLHQHSRWVVSPTEPPGALDGPADLGIAEKVSSTALGADAEPAAKEAPRGDAADPAAYFQQAVSRLAEAYDAGVITSDAAEAQLQELYAVDAGATAWMLGVQSREWYTYGGDRWQRSARALDRSALTESPEGGAVELGSSATQKIRRFLSRAARIPEPVLPAWSPPAGFPDPVVTCPHCGALNVGEVEACVSCTRPLAPVKRPPPAIPASASASVPVAPSVSQPAPQPVALDAATPAAAPPSMYTPPPARRSSRTLWFVGGGCCLLIVCLVITAVLIFALGLIPMSDFAGIWAGPLSSDPQPQLVAPADVLPSSALLEDTFDDPGRTAVPLFGPELMEFEVDADSGTAIMTAHYYGVLAAMYDSPVVGDFVATLELQPLDPAPGAGYGLIFRSDDAIDGLAHYYVALVAPADRVVTLTRWGQGGAAELVRAPYIPASDGLIQLTVRADGSRIDLEIDGLSAATVIDESVLGPGIFGLAMNSPRQGDALAFLSLLVELHGG
jgi:hypothetical protein